MRRFLKLFIFSTIVIFYCCNLERIERGSGTEIKFNTTVGGNANDFPKDIIANPDGSFVVVGYSQSFTAGDNEAYIGKLDKNGNLSWENHFGGAADDYANGVISLPDGSCVLCGSTKNPISLNDDLLVVKVNSAGAVIWNKTFGAPDSTEIGFGLCLIESSNIMVGYTSRIFGTDTEIRFMKLNAGGSRLSDGIGVQGDFEIRKMIKTLGNEIVIVGDEFSTDKASYVAKFKADGTREWSKNFIGVIQNEASGFGVVEMNDNRLICAGRHLGVTSYDFLLVNYSESGIELNNNIWGEDKTDELLAITGTKDGEIVVLGYSNNFSTKNEIYLSKRKTSDGSEIWAKHFDETWTIGADVELCPDGGFVICTGQNQANADIIIIKTDASGNYQ